MKKDLSFSHYLDVLKEFQHLWPLTCNHFHCALTPEHSVRMWYQEHKCVPHVVFSCLLLKNKTSCHESIYPLTPIKKKKKKNIYSKTFPDAQAHLHTCTETKSLVFHLALFGSTSLTFLAFSTEC